MIVSEKENLLGRARSLAAKFSDRAILEESLRAPSDETVQDLISSGILSALTPKKYGGKELGLDAMVDIVRIVSAACPSTGWITAFYIGSAWRALFFSEEGQKEIFGDNSYVLSAGTAAPLAQVFRESDGYRITGQTSWNSGSVHADWFSFTGLLRQEGAPPAHLTFMVPRSEVTVLDNWFIVGMRGTGSNDVKVDNVFVPDSRVASFVDVITGTTAGQTLHANPVYHLPFLPFAMAEVVPVMVGALRGATEAFGERVEKRHGTINGGKASAKQSLQIRLGKAMAAAGAAEALLDDLVRRLSEPVSAQREVASRIDFKLRSAFIADLCRNAVNDIVRGIGGDGFRESCAVQRYFRDLNVLAVHAFLDVDTASETAGRSELGLDLEDMLI